MNKKIKKISWLFAFSGFLILLFITPLHAYADSTAFGAQLNSAYYGGTPQNNYSLLYLLPPSPNVPYGGLTPNPGTLTYQEFVDMMHDRVFDTSSVADEGAASAVVNVMLGQSSSSFGGSYQNGIAYAQSHFQSWVDLVNFYNQQGAPGYSIEWNRFVTDSELPDAGSNSSEAVDGSGNGEPDIFFFSNLAWTGDTGYVVIFHYPGGGEFIIVQLCANILGPFVPPAPIPTYTISGDVFTDANKNMIQDNGESNYTGGITITSSAGSVTTDATDGTYSVSNLPAGTYTIKYTSLPSEYYMTSPLNGSPPSFIVTVGTSCSSNGAPGATCTGGNITDLNFGISNLESWWQATCSDVRDNPIIDMLPVGQTALVGNATCANMPGLAFTGSGSPTFGDGQVSATNQIVGGNSYPEVYPSTSRFATSYTYLFNKAQSAGINPINLATICTLSDCTLPSTLPHGLYKASGNVVLNGFTFPAGQNYVFLINGDLTVQGNIAIPVGSTAMFSTSGNIIVGANVGSPAHCDCSSLDGWYVAGQSFIVNSLGNCNDYRLNIFGSVVVNSLNDGGTFLNNRDLCADDAIYPTITFSQRLDMILNAPQFLRQEQTLSQEVAP